MHQILHESPLPLDNSLSQLMGNGKDLRMFHEELEETWKKQGLSSFQLSAQTVSNTKQTRFRRLAVLMVMQRLWSYEKMVDEVRILTSNASFIVCISHV
jgi:hypothetical protein